jgi:hypothetical protein
MNDFIPSEAFVKKTMESVCTYEAHEARPVKGGIRGIVATLFQRGTFLISCGIALANLLRLYYAVFAPVVSH